MGVEEGSLSPEGPIGPAQGCPGNTYEVLKGREKVLPLSYLSYEVRSSDLSLFPKLSPPGPVMFCFCPVKGSEPQCPPLPAILG